MILKLDVEGAEYDILEKMIRDRSIERLAHLFIEWHWNKVAVPGRDTMPLSDDLKRLRSPCLGVGRLWLLTVEMSTAWRCARPWAS